MTKRKAQGPESVYALLVYAALDREPELILNDGDVWDKLQAAGALGPLVVINFSGGRSAMYGANGTDCNEAAEMLLAGAMGDHFRINGPIAFTGLTTSMMFDMAHQVAQMKVTS